MTSYIWLPTSCFCSISKWNLLLNSIREFIVENNNLIKSYKISFSRSNGDCIQLSALTQEVAIDELAERMSNHFDLFFKTLELESSAVKVTSIFLPFPTATIQFGLYTENSDMVFFMKNRSEYILSKVLIEALRTDVVDVETILTVAFYLKIALIKALHGYLKDTTTLFEIIARVDSDGEKFLVKNKLFENQPEMGEVTKEVMLESNFEGDLFWLKEWITEIEDSLKSIEERGVEQVTTIVRNYYLDYGKIIDNQLNLNVESRRLLDHLINRSLWRYFNGIC